MSDFYLTLLSNASMDVFPDNKTGSFSNHLPKTITLDGKWMFAVTEVHYQYNFFNVTSNNSTIYFKLRGEQGQCGIAHGFYESIEDLLSEINANMSPLMNSEDFLLISNTSKHVSVNKCAFQTLTDIMFENRLALQLGFVPNTAVRNDRWKTTVPSSIANGVPDELFVYCNIAEPQCFGDELAQIIRIIDIPKKGSVYGQPRHKEFQRLQYVPVSKKCFDTLTIELRDKTGNFMPFVSGTVILVLYFKKIE